MSGVLRNWVYEYNTHTTTHTTTHTKSLSLCSALCLVVQRPQLVLDLLNLQYLVNPGDLVKPQLLLVLRPLFHLDLRWLGPWNSWTLGWSPRSSSTSIRPWPRSQQPKFQSWDLTPSCSEAVEKGWSVKKSNRKEKTSHAGENLKSTPFVKAPPPNLLHSPLSKVFSRAMEPPLPPPSFFLNFLYELC